MTLPENPWVYVICIVLFFTAVYMFAKVVIVLMPAVTIICIIGAIWATSNHDEDLSNLFIVVAIVAVLLFLASRAYISFCENDPIGQTLISSGKALIGSVGNST